jgi:hypothetical protein
MNPHPELSTYWNATIERTLRLYEQLWSESTEDAEDIVYSAWSEERSLASYVPYDGTDILIGLDAIGRHVLPRLSHSRLSHVSWRLVASWPNDGGHCSIVRQQLITIDRVSGRREARKHAVVVATLGEGAGMRLRHVSEATPAVLVEIRRSYERHALRREDL